MTFSFLSVTTDPSVIGSLIKLNWDIILTVKDFWHKLVHDDK